MRVLWLLFLVYVVHGPPSHAYLTTSRPPLSLLHKKTLNRGLSAFDPTSDNTDQDPPFTPEILVPSNENSGSDEALDSPVSRLRILRDRMWVRETINDVTSAEFVVAIESGTAASGGRSRVRMGDAESVDYGNLLQKLDRRQFEMCRGSNDDLCLALSTYSDMGSVVCTAEELRELASRIDVAKGALERKLGEGKAAAAAAAPEPTDDGPATTTTTTSSSAAPTSSASPAAAAASEKIGDVLDPTVYLRSDGTVDWDGALEAREAAKKFGVAVWSRINGRDPNEAGEGEEREGGAGGGEKKAVVARVQETAELAAMREGLESGEVEVAELEKEYNSVLNRGVDPTSSVGRVDMSRLSEEERQEILAVGEKLRVKKDALSVDKINYELERIYVFLNGEIEASSAGVIPLNDRLAVAEFGLLESQMQNINAVDVDFLDADVLRVVVDQVVDFKRRLGIDYYVQGIKFDVDSVKRWLNEVLETSEDGLRFYWKGLKLLVSDLRYSISLIAKAITGVVLKPREVRTLRRTFKDIVTFVPFLIILIIPLTPIGHVFVFGAIQRFFPEFFPSCFTERRQNLLQLFEQSEYVDLDIDEGLKERVVRVFSSFLAIVKVQAAALVGKMFSKKQGGGGEDGDQQNKP